MSLELKNVTIICGTYQSLEHQAFNIKYFRYFSTNCRVSTGTISLIENVETWLDEGPTLVVILNPATWPLDQAWAYAPCECGVAAVNNDIHQPLRHVAAQWVFTAVTPHPTLATRLKFVANI